MRALVRRLRKIPRPARRSEPSRLSSRTTSAVTSSRAVFACFLLMPSLSARCAATCDCVIILLLRPARACVQNLDERETFFKQVGRKNAFFLKDRCDLCTALVVFHCLVQLLALM